MRHPSANVRGLSYLILSRMICHPLEVAQQELQGVIIVIWEVMDLNREGQEERNLNCKKKHKEQIKI